VRRDRTVAGAPIALATTREYYTRCVARLVHRVLLH
jgi:hypothetical protein